ncbi:unnamed protein product [Ectocarpus sp. 8 AP-2014]
MSYFTWAFGLWTTAVVFVSFQTYSFSGEHTRTYCSDKGARRPQLLASSDVSLGDTTFIAIPHTHTAHVSRLMFPGSARAFCVVCSVVYILQVRATGANWRALLCIVHRHAQQEPTSPAACLLC